MLPVVLVFLVIFFFLSSFCCFWSWFPHSKSSHYSSVSPHRTVKHPSSVLIFCQILPSPWLCLNCFISGAWLCFKTPNCKDPHGVDQCWSSRGGCWCTYPICWPVQRIVTWPHSSSELWQGRAESQHPNLHRQKKSPLLCLGTVQHVGTIQSSYNPGYPQIILSAPGSPPHVPTWAPLSRAQPLRWGPLAFQILVSTAYNALQ